MNTTVQLIDIPTELNAAIECLQSERVLGVDLEADSMHHYQERVCLIQISGTSLTALIDPIKLPDLSALKPIFASPSIRKVFHGADYDVRSLYRDFGIEIENLFDTQLASMFLGFRETGLDAVVKAKFGVTLDKKFQRKDWSQRPLPPEMVAYAASDSVYLTALAAMLEKELKAAGRLAWVLEECELLSRVRPPENDRNPLFLNFRGAGRLSPRSLAVLEGLLQYRKKVAKHKDRPLFKVFGHQSLLTLARTPPRNLQELEALKALSPKQIEMYGAPILSCIGKALRVPDYRLPTYPRKRNPALPATVSQRIRRLRDWREKTADDLHIEAGLLFNKTLLAAIAKKNPQNIDALADVTGIKNWQRKAFGNDILRVVAGSDSKR